MIDLSSSRILETRICDLASSVSVIEEGTPLDFIQEAGKTVLAPATVGGKKFAGFALHTLATATTVPLVEIGTVSSTDSTFKMATSAINMANVAAFYYDNSAPFTVQSTEADAAGEVQYANGLLTFDPADNGKKIRVVYRRPITAVEAALVYGEHPFTSAIELTGNASVIRRAEVFYLDNFDITSAWDTALSGTGKVYLNANNQLTLTSTNNREIPGITVMDAPNTTSGLLGVALSIDY